MAAAGSALLVGRSHWCAAGSACFTCRARVHGLCDPQPVRGELARLAGAAGRLACVNSGWVLLVGVLVLCARFVAADAAGRAQLRVIFVVVLGLLLYFVGMVAQALGAPEDSALVVTLNTSGR